MADWVRVAYYTDEMGINERQLGREWFRRLAAKVVYLNFIFRTQNAFKTPCASGQRWALRRLKGIVQKDRGGIQVAPKNRPLVVWAKRPSAVMCFGCIAVALADVFFDMGVQLRLGPFGGGVMNTNGWWTALVGGSRKFAWVIGWEKFKFKSRSGTATPKRIDNHNDEHSNTSLQPHCRYFWNLRSYNSKGSWIRTTGAGEHYFH